MAIDQTTNTGTDRGAARWPRRFFLHFLAQLSAAGYRPDEMAKFVWKPFSPEDLRITGAERDQSFHKVEIDAAEIERHLAEAPETDVRAVLKETKLVLLLFPGFTHHTLQYPAFQEPVDEGQTALTVLKLEPPEAGCLTPRETFTNRSELGTKLVYVAYPRSNAPSEVILEPTYDMLVRSPTLRRWIAGGHRLLLVGYSYGATLALEMLEALNTGAVGDDVVLPNAEGLLTINGAIGGSYLADAVADPGAVLSVQSAARLTGMLGSLASSLGIDPDEMLEVAGGIESLGHRVRQERLARMADRMPTHLKYVSVGAFLPETDYDTNPLRNLDDSSMYLQSLASKGVSIYNDGQMVLDDCFIPEFRGVPETNRIDLGAVRSHHWGISWRTFNYGVNPFPRRPYYRALMATLHEIGVGSIDPAQSRSLAP